MKRFITPLLALLLLSACSDSAMAPDDPAGETAEAVNGDDDGEITVIARAATLTRAFDNGWYKEDYYPVDTLFLTTYHHDFTGLDQYYFQDIMLTAEDDVTFGKWRAKGWYWPLQGEMEFLSYWSPKVYGRPEFKVYEHADYTHSAWMVVPTQGSGPEVPVTSSSYHEGLDGYTDFLYIAERKIYCPHSGPIYLTYRHGLAWITVSLQAEVLDDLGQPDAAATAEVIHKIKIQRIVIEDAARKGTAYLVPGLDIAWVIPPEYVKDQVYTRPKTFAAGVTPPPRGSYSSFTWRESADGSSGADEDDYITLSPTMQYLGVYTPNNSDHYIGNGLLLIPQHKTAITVYYYVIGGKANGEDLFVAERYELRDNALEWDPGKRYHYDIIFRSSVDKLKKDNIELIETTYQILYSDQNPCYDPASFGQLKVAGSDGTQFSLPTFLLEPYHTQGSPFQDEMDYRDGGEVF